MLGPDYANPESTTWIYSVKYWSLVTANLATIVKVLYLHGIFLYLALFVLVLNTIEINIALLEVGSRFWASRLLLKVFHFR